MHFLLLNVKKMAPYPSKVVSKQNKEVSGLNDEALEQDEDTNEPGV